MQSNWLKNGFIVTKKDLINKFNYRNMEKMPDLSKVCLNIGRVRPDFKNIAASNLALELLSGAINATITKAKKDSPISLKRKKNEPVGASVTLTKREAAQFLSYFCVEVAPKIKGANFEQFLKKSSTATNAVTFTLKGNNVFCFEEIEQNYVFFKSFQELNITVVFKTKINYLEIRALFNFLAP